MFGKQPKFLCAEMSLPVPNGICTNALTYTAQIGSNHCAGVGLSVKHHQAACSNWPRKSYTGLEKRQRNIQIEAG